MMNNSQQLKNVRITLVRAISNQKLLFTGTLLGSLKKMDLRQMSNKTT